MRLHEDFDDDDPSVFLRDGEAGFSGDLVQPCTFCTEPVTPVYRNFAIGLLKMSLLGPSTTYARNLNIVEVSTQFHETYGGITYTGLTDDDAVDVWPCELSASARGFHILEELNSAPYLPLWVIPSVLGPNPHRLSRLLATDGRLNIMFCEWKNFRGRYRPGVVSMWYMKSDQQSGWWITARMPGDDVYYPAGTRVLQFVEQ